MKTQTKPEVAPIAAVTPEIVPGPMRRWRARVFQVYLIAAAAAFGTLLVLANLFSYFPIDLRITRGVQAINSAWFYGLMWAVSFPGYAPQAGLMVGAIIFALFLIGLRWEAVAALVTAAGAFGLASAIKLCNHRGTPRRGLKCAPDYV